MKRKKKKKGRKKLCSKFKVFLETQMVAASVDRYIYCKYLFDRELIRMTYNTVPPDN